MLVKKENLLVTEIDGNKGGFGICKTTNITDKEGLLEKGRVYGVQQLEPGDSVGSHIHEGDFEIYHILQGEGEVTDNYEVKKVSAGDVMFTYEGDEHSIKNIGNDTLKWMALILYV